MIGGRIVGLSTGIQIMRRFPDVSVTVADKEDGLAEHQTGHNSGVIHAGVYYAPGSLKSQFCRDGAKATVAFCEEHGLPFERCGKLIVATDDVGLVRLAALQEQCELNGLAPSALTPGNSTAANR